MEKPRFAFTILIAFLVWSSSFETCIAARRGRHWRQVSASLMTKKKTKSSHGSSGGQSHGGSSKQHKSPISSHKSPLAPPSPAPVSSTPKYSPPAAPPVGSRGKSSGATYNVMDFGAQGDGSSDDTKAFEGAWAAACKVEASTVLVPEGYEFLVGPISFSGPYCQADITFQLNGKIYAPTESDVWGRGLLWWIEFTKLKGITIQGSGTIDGRGSVWWDQAPYDDPIDDGEEELAVPYSDTVEGGSTMPALRFYGSFNVTVTGITIRNSPQCHLKFDNCVGVLVHDIAISSPGDSPNTDGIHLQNSKDVLIHSSDLACGERSSCISKIIENTDAVSKCGHELMTLTCAGGGVCVSCRRRLHLDTDRMLQRVRAQPGLRTRAWHQHRQPRQGQHQGLRLQHHRP
ncbi:hypothetical protein SAY86_002124 [Trapa natans]|uniref:Polygalacturonase n=1 Tax=Trapa natans TaxID=22666 RepID=A0AAN7R263_TRANT|nr:hypothetical protein SAY86_002124 [Trapa natans]